MRGSFSWPRAGSRQIMGPINNVRQHKALLDGLLELFQSQELCDFVISVSDVKIACHKPVLAASSKYFKAMFTSNVKETSESNVDLRDTDVDTVRAIINYMYTSEIQIDNENVQSIFTTASLFEMLDLCELCASHMKKELHITNCVGVYAFGSYHSCDSLKQAGRNFLVDHFQQVCTTEEFLMLSFSDFLDVISDDNLNVKKEETVFETVLQWIEFDLENRAYELAKLFNHIRLPLLSEEYIQERVRSHKLIAQNSYCQGLLSMAKLHKVARALGNDDENLEGLSVEDRPRLGMYNKKMMIFIGGSQDRHNRALTCFDPIAKANYYAIALHVSFDFKYRIDHHRAVVTDKNEIYIIGGIFYEEHHFEENGAALDEVKVFDAYRNCWHGRAGLLDARCGHVALHHKGKIYALGGKSTYPQGAPLSSVEVYDPEVDQWRFVSPMPIGLCHHSGVCHRDTLILMGGMITDQEVTNTFLQYDVPTDTWTVVNNTMHTPRAEFGMALVGDQIYAIGGTDGNVKLSTVEVYYMNTNRWFFGPDFPEDRKSMVTVVFSGRIYVCGGVRTLISRVHRAPRIVETKELHSYDPNTGIWTKEAKLVQYANIHACVVAEINTKRLHKSDFISSA